MFGLIPAAGSGERFGAAAGLPKQYQPLVPTGGGAAPGALPMLLHSIDALLAAPEIELVFVVLAPADEQFRTLDLGSRAPRVATLYCGGATRRDSVLNGLVAASSIVETGDWMLVHDAARPCLAQEELRRLIDAVRGDAERGHEGGGILALPVADTLKRATPSDAAGRAGDDRWIDSTLPRAGLWQAQTPQMFRHGVLLDALRGAPLATDEASAAETLGLRPRLVQGSSRNIKVTHAPDLALAALILQAAGRL
ncbi:MAG: 2-C-methyl-D-erythritol 4-phosphate cytidylyltransferase [Betaproteobacteria bacterium]|nr:2-C-methyl-D-erythritol 4-phosphate cytidylyltransferase [Betaproteobacteria bacterium]